MTKIFVGNLSYDATEADVRAAFETQGEVASVSLISDKMTGRPRGFGFVEMPDDGAAKAAITALNLTEIQGRAITVNEARPRTEGGGGRGGFGGGGGGGGGGGRGGYGGGRKGRSW